MEEQTQIGAPLDQLARHITLGAAGQLHLQEGIVAGQLVEAVDHRLIGHRFVLGYPQQGFLAAHEGQCPAIEALALAQQLAGIFQQRAAAFGQLGLPAAAALEQHHAKVRFEQGDCTADRRLSLALLTGDGRKRA
ncbi:hypothetical protein D3C80_1565490 [compost metagenome]